MAAECPKIYETFAADLLALRKDVAARVNDFTTRSQKSELTTSELIAWGHAEKVHPAIERLMAGAGQTSDPLNLPMDAAEVKQGLNATLQTEEGRAAIAQGLRDLKSAATAGVDGVAAAEFLYTHKAIVDAIIASDVGQGRKNRGSRTVVRNVK